MHLTKMGRLRVPCCISLAQITYNALIDKSIRIYSFLSRYIFAVRERKVVLFGVWTAHFFYKKYPEEQNPEPFKLSFVPNARKTLDYHLEEHRNDLQNLKEERKGLISVSNER